MSFSELFDSCNVNNRLTNDWTLISLAMTMMSRASLRFKPYQTLQRKIIKISQNVCECYSILFLMQTKIYAQTCTQPPDDQYTKGTSKKIPLWRPWSIYLQHAYSPLLPFRAHQSLQLKPNKIENIWPQWEHWHAEIVFLLTLSCYYQQLCDYLVEKRNHSLLPPTLPL